MRLAHALLELDGQSDQRVGSSVSASVLHQVGCRQPRGVGLHPGRPYLLACLCALLSRGL